MGLAYDSQILSCLGLARRLSRSASAQSVGAGIEAWQRADYARPSRSGGRSRKKATPTPPSISARPIASAAACRPTSRRRQTWFERAANKGHIDAQTTLGLLLFENGDRAAGLKWLKAGGRQRGTPRAARLRHRPVQRRRGKAGPHPRLCLCQPRGGAGPGAGSGDARATRPDSPARAAQESARDRHGKGENHAPTEVGAAHDPNRSRRRPLPQSQP